MFSNPSNIRRTASQAIERITRHRITEANPIPARHIWPIVLGGAVVLALALTAAAHAAERVPIAVLKDRWAEANGKCRGSTDRAEAAAGCARRDALDKQLEARGLCFAYVRSRSGGLDSIWRPCWPPRDPEMQ